MTGPGCRLRSAWAERWAWLSGNRRVIVGLVCAAALLLAGAPRAVAGASSGQSFSAEIAPSVGWGSAAGCAENLGTEDFGALTPVAGVSVLEPFGALPPTQASTNAQGDGVWVGCVTTDGVLASITAQATSGMSDPQGAVLPLADVAIGTTNSPPGGQCEIAAGQGSAGGCSLTSAPVTLLSGAGAGTSEIDWQYQLRVPANQLPGDYTGGLVTFTATASSPPPPVVPVDQIAPGISPAGPQVGTIETAAPGTWTGPATGYQYQWEDCSGSTCTAIAGATGQSYTPVGADAGDTLEVTVTASDSAGSASATSAPTSAVTQPPANTVAPALSTSSPTVASALSVSAGTWVGSPTPTFSYQWADCSGQTCTAIAGATSATYTPTGADIGDALQATVTATNSAGTARAATVQSRPVSEQPPVEQSLPSATPTVPQQGTPETATTGTWTNGPTAFTYQWEDCSGSTCTAIAGATSQTYMPTGADVGEALEVAVTASNLVGSATASSAHTSAVIAPAGAESEFRDVDSGIFTNALLAEGADGNEWIANEDNSTPVIQRVTPAGAITSYPLPGGSTPSSMTLGPDGNVWFTAYLPARIGKITPSGQITTYFLSAGTCPDDIVTGPDNNLWVTLSCSTPAQIVRITTSGTMTSYTIPGGGSPSPEDIAVGPNGALWFTESGADAIGEITTAGSFSTPIAVGAIPQAIALGPDGDAWVTLGLAHKIDKITATGQITSYPGPFTGNLGFGIAPGADGAMWFAAGGSTIGRITTGGVVTTFQIASGSDAESVAEGSGGLEWFDGSESAGTIAPVQNANAPVSSVQPTVTGGTPAPGVAISVTSTGTWSASPSSFTYQWYQCIATADCTAIAGATNSTYTPLPSQAGDTLQAAVIASNANASGEATSAPTAVVS